MPGIHQTFELTRGEDATIRVVMARAEKISDWSTGNAVFLRDLKPGLWCLI